MFKWMRKQHRAVDERIEERIHAGSRPHWLHSYFGDKGKMAKEWKDLSLDFNYVADTKVNSTSYSVEFGERVKSFVSLMDDYVNLSATRSWHVILTNIDYVPANKVIHTHVFHIDKVIPAFVTIQFREHNSYVELKLPPAYHKRYGGVCSFRGENAILYNKIIAMLEDMMNQSIGDMTDGTFNYADETGCGVNGN